MWATFHNDNHLLRMAFQGEVITMLALIALKYMVFCVCGKDKGEDSVKCPPFIFKPKEMTQQRSLLMAIHEYLSRINP